ncbi:hypothetical protein DIZ27_38070 [Streptomyces sp. NWU339]|nr:hypothetical protein DIZ27_38070 [Streptomyces sp. NWU339]
MLGGVDEGEQGPASAGPGGVLPAVSVRALRGPAVRRLLALRREGKLTTGHVRLLQVAACPSGADSQPAPARSTTASSSSTAKPDPQSPPAARPRPSGGQPAR